MKKIEVLIFKKPYYVLFKREGIYFYSKIDKNDLLIPYKEIDFYEGVCLDDKYFYKITYKKLFSIYIILTIVFFILNFPKSLSMFAIYTTAFIIFFWILKLKTTFVMLYADLEKIPIKFQNNEDLCIFLRKIRKIIKKENLKDRISLIKKSIFKKGRSNDN